MIHFELMIPLPSSGTDTFPLHPTYMQGVMSSFSCMVSPRCFALGPSGITTPKLQVKKLRPCRWGPAAQL